MYWCTCTHGRDISSRAVIRYSCPFCGLQCLKCCYNFGAAVLVYKMTVDCALYPALLSCINVHKALLHILSFTNTHIYRRAHLSVIVSLSPLATPFITVLAFGVRTTWETKKVPFLLQEAHEAVLQFLFCFLCILSIYVKHLMASAAEKFALFLN